VNLATLYPWCKALHVAAVILFVAGTLAQALVLAAINTDPASAIADKFRRAERLITVPAMIVALSSGMLIAQVGHWFPSRWLILKLVLVVVVLGIHGLQTGQLRRVAAAQSLTVKLSPYALLLLVTAIAVLAVVKP
jgi:protoporphyrinogen IX oxidase